MRRRAYLTAQWWWTCPVCDEDGDPTTYKPEASAGLREHVRTPEHLERLKETR